MDSKIVKDEVLEVIIETRDDIEIYSNNLQKLKNEVIDIDVLKAELTKITKQLGDYSSVVKKIIALNEGFISHLEKLYIKLEKSNFTIIKYRKEILMELLKCNLPDGIDIENIEGTNKWTLVPIQNEEINPKYSANKLRTLNYDGVKMPPIGEIVLLDNQGKLILDVEVKGKKQEFKIDNCFKVYPIITFVLTKDNYNDEG